MHQIYPIILCELDPSGKTRSENVKYVSYLNYILYCGYILFCKSTKEICWVKFTYTHLLGYRYRYKCFMQSIQLNVT